MREAQNLGSHLGSVLRLNDDGSAPEDNPFIGREDALPEIFSYGHRNVQGLTLHPDSGALWSHEHGPRGGDEVNILQPGANRSEEHTSELQSLMRSSYADFCLKNTNRNTDT